MEKRVSPIAGILGSIGVFGKALVTNYDEEVTEDWKEFSEKNKDDETVKMINEEMRKLRNSEYKRKQAKKAIQRGAIENLKTQMQNPEKRPKMRMELEDKELQK